VSYRWSGGTGGVLAVALLIAGCSSTHSLAQDQQVVNSLQARVNQEKAGVSTDQTNIAADKATDLGCAIQGQLSSSLNCPVYVQPRHHLHQDEAQERKDEANLKADKFNLQVAEDQLKKDESGSLSGRRP
jgi:hypothetical protein